VCSLLVSVQAKVVSDKDGSTRGADVEEVWAVTEPSQTVGNARLETGQADRDHGAVISIHRNNTNQLFKKNITPSLP